MAIANNIIHVLSRGVIIDQGHILLCQTSLDFPTLFYCLPGGHIEHGESAEACIVREMKEESGVDCGIKRFLGCLEYHFDPGQGKICHDHEYNFVFELESNTLKKDYQIPRLENHIELMWMPLEKIHDIDFRATPLKECLPTWVQSRKQNNFKSVMK